jgi:hypothetical protein
MLECCSPECYRVVYGEDAVLPSLAPDALEPPLHSGRRWACVVEGLRGGWGGANAPQLSSDATRVQLEEGEIDTMRGLAFRKCLKTCVRGQRMPAAITHLLPAPPD